MIGKLYAVGVGPGEPELLTLKALKALTEAQVIAVPKGKAEKDSVALSIISKFVEGKQILELVFPMTGEREVLNESWDEAADEVGGLLEQGKVVVFATLGDPSLYSTFTYLLSTLKNKYDDLDVEIIPGINSFSAAASRLQLPLAEGGENLAVIPVPANTSRLKEVLNLFDTVILLKVHRYFDRIMEVLLELGLEEKGYFISRCGNRDEFVSNDLKSLAGKKLDYLSMMIIKK
ncbi:MAG: precorrin-2 C(20)-methyltransferase [Firmicutes bacterium HGW-Firmicutes-13]|nr:MAG: precorrin-2 C(20)-methyltransferase [Firmicutes bacterium HGW-Firmicutes-13]